MSFNLKNMQRIADTVDHNTFFQGKWDKILKKKKKKKGKQKEGKKNSKKQIRENYCISNNVN